MGLSIYSHEMEFKRATRKTFWLMLYSQDFCKLLKSEKFHKWNPRWNPNICHSSVSKWRRWAAAFLFPVIKYLSWMVIVVFKLVILSDAVKMWWEKHCYIHPVIQLFWSWEGLPCVKGNLLNPSFPPLCSGSIPHVVPFPGPWGWFSFGKGLAWGRMSLPLCY